MTDRFVSDRNVRETAVRRGRIAAVGLTVFGIFVAVLLIAVMGALPMLAQFQTYGAWFLPSLVCVPLIWAWLLGAKFSAMVFDGWNGLVQGILLALSVVIASALSVALPLALLDRQTYVFGAMHAIESYVFVPLFWLLLVGVVPCCVLGAVWGAVIRGAVRNLEVAK